MYCAIIIGIMLVIDAPKGITLLPLKTGGFVLQVQIKAPLLIWINLRIVYIDAGNTSLETSRFSDVSFFNSTTIYYVECSDRVPYDSFKLKVGLVHEDIEGPLSEYSSVHGRYSL